MTVTGGEPLLQPEFLKEFFRLCQEQGLHTALDTSGFVCTSKAWEVLDYADLVLLDIKTLNPDLHPLLAGVKQDNRLEALARYVSSYKVVRKVELLPYHTMGTYKYEQLGLDYPLKGVEPLSKERLDNAKAIFSRYKPENNKA